jgi:alkylation response protein AidB-like acyl-CoA dehydrogenase
MMLTLPERAMEIQRAARASLGGTVEWQTQCIRRGANGDAPLSAFPTLAAVIENLWAEEAAIALLVTALVSEEAGYAFSPLSPRPPLLLAWLRPRLDSASQARLRSTHSCTVSTAGDGVAENASVRAVCDANGRWRLEGEIGLIEDVGATAAVLLEAHCDETSGLFLLSLDQEGVQRTAAEPLDVARPAFALDMGKNSPAFAEPMGCSGARPAIFAQLRTIARISVAAEMVGIAQLMMELAIRYARSRSQFGQNIGNFQAIAHRCAEMLCDVELVRALLYARASDIDLRVDGRAESAKVKMLAGHYCPAVVDRACHVFGAEGLTWHRGLHYAVRRIQALGMLWGNTLECGDEAATLLDRKLALALA